jgi:periplasmic protein TonB
MKKTYTILLVLLSTICFAQTGEKVNEPIQSGTRRIKIFEVSQLDEKPEFPGGDAELLKYLAQNTKCPVIEQENAIESRIYVRFVVSRTGEVGQAKVIRHGDPRLEKEVLRVIRSLPKWKPGKIKGKPVNTWFIIPVGLHFQ